MGFNFQVILMKLLSSITQIPEVYTAKTSISVVEALGVSLPINFTTKAY